MSAVALRFLYRLVGRAVEFVRVHRMDDSARDAEILVPRQQLLAHVQGRRGGSVSLAGQGAESGPGARDRPLPKSTWFVLAEAPCSGNRTRTPVARSGLGSSAEDRWVL
jgi:hypothetical protein